MKMAGHTGKSMGSNENVVCPLLHIFPAAPFAAAQGLPPQVWQAISVLLKGAQ